MMRTKQTARRSGHTVAAGTKAQQALTKGPMQTALQHLDYKLSDKSVWYYAETKEDKEVPEQMNWWDMYALCLVRQFRGKFVDQVTLRVNSPHLKDTLKEVIGTFPGISFETKNITIAAPYRVLYHYRPELYTKREQMEDDTDAAKHLDLLLEFIDEEFKDTIADSDNLQEKNLMSYELLWTIFRPGSMVFSLSGGQPRMFKLNSYHYSCDPQQFVLAVSFVDFDGEDFGTRNTTLEIPRFAGAAAIMALATTPAELNEERERLSEMLIVRGKRFQELAGMHFRHYSGIAVTEKSRFSHDGRVVVDTKTFHRINADEAFTVSPFPGTNTNDTRAFKRLCNGLDAQPNGNHKAKLTDEQLMLASSTVRGFSFTEKEWFDFQVDGLSKIEWNSKCFEKLVLPSAQKETVKALVSTHVNNSLGFDDIVKGKGLGLILVLHGPPGVGKTLTAETVAEFCQRPLYSVSSGDLGIDSTTLDQKLGQILDLASTWKAVLLIDEADIFLERRSLHDMQRNSLVSIFLRVLEYYQGILFCTTNRVTCFDDAFKSRIHVPLKYDDLSTDSRKQIWHNLLHNMPNVKLDKSDYDRLADVNLNGRQIKNVIRTAKSLAEYHGEQLDASKLQQVVDIQNEFEQELEIK